MKEKILNALRELGFELEKMENFGYGFRYEGINYLYMPNDDDEDFLNISVPAIIEKDEIEESAYTMLLDKTNSTLKYIKANTLGDGLWLFYERELFGNEDLEELLQRMILRLEAGTFFVRQEIRNSMSEDIEDDVESGNEVVMKIMTQMTQMTTNKE